MKKISAVVSVYNEEKQIENCLRSLKFADEIILVDNGSTDNTIDRAKKYTSSIFSQKNDFSSIDLQKNFGFEKASGNWILSIDADEEVSPQLSKEIAEVLKKDTQGINGFWIPRKNYIFGKWIKYSGWYPDLQLRLFRKGKGKYTKKHVHEPITLEGKSEELKEHIIHNNYETIEQFLKKTLIYAPNEAEELIIKGYKFSHFDAINFPLKEFLSRFFARKGYRDGLHGLILSIYMAFYHFIIFTFVWEKTGFRQYDSDNFLKETEGELRKSGKEITYWFKRERLDNVKSPFKKNLQKLANKLNKG